MRGATEQTIILTLTAAYSFPIFHAVIEVLYTCQYPRVRK